MTEFFPSQDGEFRLDPSYEESHPASSPEHVDDCQALVAYRNARLIEVSNHEHLYFAAINSGTVRLTALGRHYWRLAREGRL
jgi:hypothetical protein